jgi:HlyD family type I secretion membrane fusion protein
MTAENHYYQQPWYRGVPLSAKWPIIIGIGVLLLWGGGFAVWAGFAPLSGAVVAPGTFVATGQNKLVQHLEGGIIRELMAREGDLVDAGQKLVRIDETLANAKLRRLILKKHRLLAMKARLEADISGKEELHVPATLAENAVDPEVKAIVEGQRSELQARRASRAAEELVLRKEIAGIEESMHGYQAQVESTQRRIAMFGEELRDKGQLLKSQLIRKADVLMLERAEAGLVGTLGEMVSRIADAKERIARADQRIVHLKSVAIESMVQELQKVETEFDDIQEQIHAAQDVVDRTAVLAPARGIIVKLNFHTAGAVVGPGAVILELLPVSEELIIEAQVKPSDVSHVSVGQEALVRLSTLSRRTTPTLVGYVTYLSADALREQMQSMQSSKDGQLGGARRDYYVVRVRLDEEDVGRRMREFQPTPGMPADVYIKTGERTFFEYIMRPVLDSFSHAFRES